VNGSLSCFCEKEYANHGVRAISKNYIARERAHKNVVGEETKYIESTPQPICQSYFNSQYYSENFYPIYGLTVFCLNTLFFFLVEPLTKFLQLHFLNRERLVVSLGYFLVIIMNSVCVPILVRGNFSEYTSDPELSAIFNGGPNTDFGDAWYL